MLEHFQRKQTTKAANRRSRRNRSSCPFHGEPAAALAVASVLERPNVAHPRSPLRITDSVVDTDQRPAVVLQRLDLELRLKLMRQAVPAAVLAERPDLGTAAALMLSDLGFVAAPWRSGTPEPDLDHGLMLIIGDRFAPDFLNDVLNGPWTTRLDRVVLFGDRLGGRTLAALDEIGFPFIVKSLPTPERLASILALADPSTAALRQSTVARRTAAAAEIETGSDRLFELIRAGNLGAAIAEAKGAFNHFEALLDSAAAAHWLSIIQSYHDGTAQHCSLVSAIAMLFARGLGFSAGDQRRLFEAAHFHDVGKVHVPLSILDKPGALDPEERRVMETHARAGYDMLVGNDAVPGEVAEAARDHHEYLDGTGYPQGIGGRRIADITRMITICDIFAALIERRAYKAPRTAREAYAIMQSMDGKLDATLLRAFSPIAESCSSG